MNEQVLARKQMDDETHEKQMDMRGQNLSVNGG